MGFFALLGFGVFLYYLISILIWIFADADAELFYNEKFGKPISSLRGKVVWITGASAGIGKGLALVLAKSGVKLCLSARRLDELEKVKLECLKLAGTKLGKNDILTVKMDMLEMDKHQEQFDKVVKYFGEIDVLVNNAGRSQRAYFKDIELNVDRDLFELDVFSILNLTRCYCKYIEAHNLRGHVVVNSSTAGLISVPESASYTGAKHALHGYFETLRMEMPDMTVSIFCPGPTYSDFLQNVFTDKIDKKYEERVTPLKRMTAERCGVLMGIAIANKLHMNYVGNFPIPLLITLTVYFPNLRTIIFHAMGGLKGMKKLRDPSNVKMDEEGAAAK